MSDVRVLRVWGGYMGTISWRYFSFIGPNQEYLDFGIIKDTPLGVFRGCWEDTVVALQEVSFMCYNQ